ncbi:MAG: hypothetical protein ACYTAF_17040 [Planctomycetota bacterium]|jgi:kynureninase
MAPVETDPLLKHRDRFPTLEKLKHFISHSLGAMPREAYDALREFGDTWVEKSVEAWHDWRPMVVECGDRIGRIIGAPPGTVVMHQNVSAFMAILASCLDYSKRSRIVLTDMNFPTVGYVWKEQERYGAGVRVVPSDGGITVDTQRIIDAIDERTAAVRGAGRGLPLREEGPHHRIRAGVHRLVRPRRALQVRSREDRAPR